MQYILSWIFCRCLEVCLGGPAINKWLVQKVTLPSPKDGCDRLQHHNEPERRGNGSRKRKEGVIHLCTESWLSSPRTVCRKGLFITKKKIKSYEDRNEVDILYCSHHHLTRPLYGSNGGLLVLIEPNQKLDMAEDSYFSDICLTTVYCCINEINVNVKLSFWGLWCFHRRFLQWLLFGGILDST